MTQNKDLNAQLAALVAQVAARQAADGTVRIFQAAAADSRGDFAKSAQVFETEAALQGATPKGEALRKAAAHRRRLAAKQAR